MSILVCAKHNGCIEMASDSVIAFSSDLIYSTDDIFEEQKISVFEELDIMMGFVGDYTMGLAFRAYIEMEGKEYFNPNRRFDRKYSPKQKMIAFYRDFRHITETMSPPVKDDGCTAIIFVWGSVALVFVNQSVHTISEGATLALGSGAALVDLDHEYGSIRTIVQDIIRHSDDCTWPVMYASLSESADGYTMAVTDSKLKATIL